VTRHEDLRFRAGDASLAGTLTVPDAPAAERLPWVVLVGSWLPRDRDGNWDRDRHPSWFRPDAGQPGILRRLAESLAERGAASLRYDPRGCAASDGDWAQTDLFTRIDDARDAIGAMRSRPELDLRRTAIVGHGEGAAIALSVAIGDPAVGAVGFIGPGARSWRSVLRRGVAERSRTGTDRQHPFVAALDRGSEELLERAERREAVAMLNVADEPVRIGLAATEQAIHTPALALATMLHRPTVLAHAADDAWADADESRLLVEVLRDAGNDPVLQLVEAGGHDLAGAGDDVVEAFADALVSQMVPRELPPVLVAIEEMGGRTH
jgi:alpha-beta hydrolase superfamily lysophospholipase